MTQRNAFILKASVLLYQTGIAAYRIGVRIAAIFNVKAALWFKGRQMQQDQIKSLSPDTRRIWVHCASLGEFEQGRPIMEGLNRLYPEIPIVLTFYSPSGFELRKNYPLAEHIFYLPADTPANAAFFIQQLNPCLAVFIKYEFWYFYLHKLKDKRIPTILISALFREDQVFFKNYGAFFKSMLSCFTRIFVQNKASYELLLQHHFQDVQISGDTRIDSVLKRAATPNAIPFIKKFVENALVLVAGSTWPADEEHLFSYLEASEFQDWKFIMAPHDIQKKHLEQIEKLAAKFNIARFSAIEGQDLAGVKILLIDNIGMLFDLYQYADIAYIGGGFGKSIHNTLEPAAFGLPVIFGPKYQKFEEARAFIQNGGGFPVHGTADLNTALTLLHQENRRNTASRAINQWMEENKGGSPVILNYIKTILS